MAKEKKIRNRKVKEPFWKVKASPELKHLTDHIGKIIDKSNTVEIMDALINLGTAYFGARAFGWPGLIIGPIALKLAQARNIVAGTSGVVTLGIIGLANTSPVQDAITAMLDPNMIMVAGKLYPTNEVLAPSFEPHFPWALTCPEGYELKRGPSAAFCVPV